MASRMSLTPVPSEQGSGSCAHCGAALVADQRYCLSCGQPCSPVRLAFLDVLQGESASGAPGGQQRWLPADTIDMSPLGYGAHAEHGAAGWLRRYSGLLSLLSVLVLCLIAGLLVGHWVTQGKAPSGPQVVEIKGLSGIPVAAGTGGAGSTAAATPGTSATSSSSTAKEEAEEAKEAAKETAAEKAPPPTPVKVSSNKINKLSQTTGKKHQEEVNALGSQPIETG